MPLYTTSFPSITVQSTGTLGWSDVILTRDAANTLALVNGPLSQTLDVYNTKTDPSNYQRVALKYSGTEARLITENLGTGGAQALGLYGTTTVNFGLSGAGVIWQLNASGHFLAQTDNTYDIGASGATRPRNYFGAGYVQTGAIAVASLPAASTALKGARHFVTDANAATFGTTAAGGGANNVPVVCNGTAWVIG